MKVKTSLNKVLKRSESQAARQTAVLFSSDILGIVLGVGVSVINTRLLSPEGFGDFKYITNLLAFVLVIFEFGIFNTGGRLIALKQYERIKSDLLGSIVFLSAAVSVLFAASFFLISYAQEAIYHNGLGSLLRMLIPFLLFFPFRNFLEKILEGDNKIYELSWFRIAPRVLYIVAVLAISYWTSLTVFHAMSMQMLTIAILLPIVYKRIGPTYNNLKENLKTLSIENKQHGLQVYLGSLFSNGSQNLGTFTISFFLDNVSVGFFVLACTIAQPLMKIPQTIGTTLYKKFANSNRIPTNILLLTLGVTLGVYVVFMLIIKYVVVLVYSEEYLPVVPVVYLVSISFIVQGFSFFMNRFLNSHGKGVMLRNASFIRGGINILGFFFLVKYFGLDGACATLIISNALYLLFLIYSYSRYVKSQDHG